MAPSIAIHGGAGDLARYTGTGRLEEAQVLLDEIITHCHTMLVDGKSALDAVCAAVVRMEDSGLFHAGKGSSPTPAGTPELDASIMDGSNMEAGAVTLVSKIKNPILLARVVMEHSQHVLLAGKAAEELADKFMLEVVNNNYYFPCDTAATETSTGTVGAVARDLYGNYAAATSTGGTLRKASGRIGDSPLIGSGTYAQNHIGAVSCTGYGEYFIRAAASATVLHRVDLLGETIGAATGGVLSLVSRLGGQGGIIGIGPRGEVSMVFNTSGMYRASIDAWSKKTVGVLA
ncbi:MAG: isoaspartyl peptidase/L-asparaginase [Chlorobi bacterium]|jgi:Asparaginase|nr:MAG: isoaspartyl peptidase/L-asparaginase [Bacteroidota bacterium]KXK34607.1 MAG: peptidase T2 asparaginase 2 [Chlorobi bacterium OLB6]MBE2265929.1 isoaspartyl peptidase/L-asparaginase [Flavobacteriales bacterium]MBL1160910.1 isoaspartyl peptidase/L-asparaginase [Chlorobiota bacterium]MBW7852871.1 isoaspartyl peptidase/L-asparaginase [Candidatus Kapabacteria bacterium]MCC6330898.1 isoaspartyl peptidase/L-asparaginase [Ignavibacteria bacterium]